MSDRRVDAVSGGSHASADGGGRWEIAGAEVSRTVALTHGHTHANINAQSGIRPASRTPANQHVNLTAERHDPRQ